MTQTVKHDEFLDLVGRSGLVAAAVVEAYQEESQSADSAGSRPDDLARRLVDDGLLTPFQSRELLRGRWRGFFVDDKYKILHLLGTGGMGTVVLCEHLMLQRLVAVKLMSPTLAKLPGTVERFLREARASAAMDHVHIARIFDVDRSSRGPYLVMEYVDGTTLHDLVTAHGPLAIDRAADYIRQAALGLQHAHEAGLVHRDVKPSNLMVDRSGTVKLLDLGLARFFDTGKNGNLTANLDAEAVMGTADFIAPEQALESSSADIRADIYSLGCTFYFLLLRKLAVPEGSLIQKLLSHQAREPDAICSLRPEVPAALAAIVERMMRKKPADRFQTPAEVAEALGPWTALPIAPPAAEEMPGITPAMFRLGLCGPMSTSPGAVRAPASARSRLPDAASTPSGDPADVSTNSLRGRPTGSDARVLSCRLSSGVALAGDEMPDPTQATLVTVAVQSPQHAPLQPAAAVPVGRRRRSVGLLAAGAALVGIVAVAIWLATRPGGPGTIATPPGVLPPPAGLNADSGALAAADAAAAARAAGGLAPRGVTLRGGGSTFVRPIMDEWTRIYEQQTGVRIEYTAVGSSKGIEGVTSKFLDFGCSDAFLSDKQLTDAGGPLIHIPLVMGAVVPTYNVPDESGQSVGLHFTGPLLANIYLGRISNWNDPAIAVNNPGQTLPDLEIEVVYRKEGSGTTSIWTDYLSKASSAWKREVGSGTTVPWPVGVAAEKNDGVADKVSRTPGAIGYVELSFALANGLPVGLIKNQAGVFVKPSVEGITAAAAASLRSIPDDLRYSLTDAPGQASYPIVGTAWALLYLDQPPGKGLELVKFLRWATGEGQQSAGQLRYGRLPPDLVVRIHDALDAVSGAGAQP